MRYSTNDPRLLRYVEKDSAAALLKMIRTSWGIAFFEFVI
jgi:hypothetical protein